MPRKTTEPKPEPAIPQSDGAGIAELLQPAEAAAGQQLALAGDTAELFARAVSEQNRLAILAQAALSENVQAILKPRPSGAVAMGRMIEMLEKTLATIEPPTRLK